jgi:hypothetical protein
LIPVLAATLGNCAGWLNDRFGLALTGAVEGGEKPAASC